MTVHPFALRRQAPIPIETIMGALAAHLSEHRPLTGFCSVCRSYLEALGYGAYLTLDRPRDEGRC